MKKILIILMLFMMTFSLAFVYAESTGNGDVDDSSDDSGNDDAPECVVDADCGEGLYCDSRGECEDLDDSSDDSGNDDVAECTLDSDCDADETCVSGECEDLDENETDDDLDDDVDENETDDDLDDDSAARIRSDAREKYLRECVDDSAIRNMNDLSLKMKEAREAGELRKVEELRNKLEELSLKIRQRTAECTRLKNANLGSFVSAAVKYRDGNTSDLVQYYKLKLSEISDETNIDARIEMLRQLRSEIDGQVRELMQKKSEIRQEEIKDLVEKIEIRRDKIDADGVEVDSEGKTIIAEINGKEVEIKIDNGRIKIVLEGVEADSEALTLENDTLMLGDYVIKVLPPDVQARYKFKVKEMNLEEEQERAVYKIKYEERKKILGLFKAKAEKRADINAESGDLDNEKGPWWEFLSTDDNSVEVEEDAELEVETETTE